MPKINTRQEYDALKALNYSGAKELLKSPAHYQAWLNEPRKETPALAIGTAVLHEPRIAVSKTIADDIPKEKERLRAAVASMREAVDEMLATNDIDTLGEIGRAHV